MPNIEYVTFADGSSYVFYNVTSDYSDNVRITRLRCVWMICAGDE